MKINKIIIVLTTILLLGTNVVYAENETTGTTNTNTTENNKTEETSQNETKNETSANTTQNTQTNNDKEEAKKEETTPKETTTQNNKEIKQEEEQKSKKTNKTENTNNKSTPTTKEAETKTTKSSNADLGNLGIVPYDFSGFVSSKTEYAVSVPNTVKSVEVYAKAKDSSAKISGTGNIDLQEGKNTAKVEVTAEDGTQKTYSIVITRLKVGEKIDEQKADPNLCLRSIKIEGCELNPQFETSKYKYTVNFEGEQTKLNITTEANVSSDIIQIIGNDNFVDGENLVTILVSDSSEKNTTIYEITVNKNLEKLKALKKEKEDAENWENIKKWGLRILIFVAIFALMAIIIIRHRKSQYEEEKEEEIPKSLRKNKVKVDVEERSNNKKSKGKHGK